jgi:hypothetical protein
MYSKTVMVLLLPIVLVSQKDVLNFNKVIVGQCGQDSG